MARKSSTAVRDVLLPPQRQLDLDVHQVMSVIPILPYHSVADVGCGKGYFTVPLAKYLFDGKVYALDADQKMLDATKESADRSRLTNVEPILAKGYKLGLDEDSLDGALAAFVVHEVAAEDLLKQLHKCVRKGGWVALLEWRKEKMDEGPPLTKRVDEDDLRKLAEGVGFRFTTRRSLNEKQYMLLLRK